MLVWHNGSYFFTTQCSLVSTSNVSYMQLGGAHAILSKVLIDEDDSPNYM